MKRVAVVAGACIAAASAGAMGSPITALNNWDAGWYRMIAEHGYWYHPGEQSPVAFFPGFPLTIAALHFVGVPTEVAGVVLSLVFGLGALFVFSRWADNVKPEAAGAATLTFALWPLAFFLFGVVYADGLFILLIAGAFLALERDEVWLATLLGALATGCRPVAPAVVVGLVARAIERRGRVRPADLVLVLAAAGFVAYLVYLQSAVGDAFAFVKVQAAPGWDQPPGFHTWLKITFIDAFRSGKLDALEKLRLVGHLSATLLAAALLWPTYKRLGWGYALFCVAAVGLPALSSKDFIGLGRYVMAAFPLFLTAGLLLNERPRFKVPVWAVSGTLLLTLAYAFGSGAYLS